ncbi:MAG TPA: DUF433 domain-containing protein [Dehalococcoidia bacterium]|nr:DUF433 domain-containing protein [Dehalococcoidia bacterium]
MANVKEIAPRIVVDADVHFGKAVIKGTRVPIEVILEQLALGGSVAEVADEYAVTVDDVLAVLKYAHDVIASEQVRAV